MKILYDILSPVIDSLYEKTFSKDTSEEEISKYCEFIAETIESAGWTTDEYMLEYMSRGLPELNPPTIDPKAN